VYTTRMNHYATSPAAASPTSNRGNHARKIIGIVQAEFTEDEKNEFLWSVIGSALARDPYAIITAAHGMVGVPREKLQKKLAGL